MTKKQHRSARGTYVNFDELLMKNKKTVAVGNANMNAAGDLLGPGGKVVQDASSHQQAALRKAYGNSSEKRSKKQVKYVSLKDNVDNLTKKNAEELANAFTEDELTGKGAKTPSEVMETVDLQAKEVAKEVAEKKKTKEKASKDEELAEEATKKTSGSKRKIIDSEE